MAPPEISGKKQADRPAADNANVHMSPPLSRQIALALF